MAPRGGGWRGQERPRWRAAGALAAWGRGGGAVERWWLRRFRLEPRFWCRRSGHWRPVCQCAGGRRRGQVSGSGASDGGISGGKEGGTEGASGCDPGFRRRRYGGRGGGDSEERAGAGRGREARGVGTRKGLYGRRVDGGLQEVWVEREGKEAGAAGSGRDGRK